MANELEAMGDLESQLGQAKQIHAELAAAYDIAEQLRDLVDEIDPEGVSLQLRRACDRAKELKETLDGLDL